MKFCPQCGTTFEPEARFCLECGFDKSTVDAEITTPVNTVPLASDKAGCPQCGTALDPSERFCPECGFDSANSKAVDPPVSKAPEPIIMPEVILPVTQVEEPAPQALNKAFCPQCGQSVDSGERFCPECGYDNLSGNTASQPAVRAPEPPKPANRPEPVVIPPVAKPVQPTPQPARTAAPVYNTSSAAPMPAALQKGKTNYLMIALIILGIGALGAGGWYGYTKFFAGAADETATPAASTPAIQPETVTEDLASDAVAVPEEEITNSEQPLTSTKPLSRVDQELAKYKAKEQNNTAIDESQVRIIYEVGRNDQPKRKSPKEPAKLMLQKSTMVVRITTDHFNEGMGTSGGGNITIKDREGNIIGNYRANTSDGKDGTPNAKWVAYPKKVLEKGTYFITDSDNATWSKNFVGNGFIVVEGYEVK